MLVWIALYVHDAIIRPYIGDVLVVIFIYYFSKAFLEAPAIKIAVWVLIFSYMIEVLQYFKIVKLLGLQHSKIANIVMGNSFAWIDIAAYTAGITIITFIERKGILNR